MVVMSELARPHRFYEVVHGVYFDDLDAFQVLHNARYLVFFERTVGAFWRQLGFTPTLDPAANPDQFQLVRANHIDYLRAVRGVCDVRVRVWVEKLGRTSAVFGCSMMPLDEDVAYATGQRVLVRVDPSTMRPTPWTEDFRKRLLPFVRQAA